MTEHGETVDDDGAEPGVLGDHDHDHDHDHDEAHIGHDAVSGSGSGSRHGSGAGAGAGAGRGDSNGYAGARAFGTSPDEAARPASLGDHLDRIATLPVAAWPAELGRRSALLDMGVVPHAMERSVLLGFAIARVC